MARILGIDYGLKRTGIAVTDPLQIIVNAMETVNTLDLREWLERYIEKEPIEKIVIGLPTHKDGNYTHIKPNLDALYDWCSTKWPNITMVFADERYTSTKAKSVILKSGAKKKVRQDKALVDRVSAAIILQQYLGHI
jgi:putative Holliday junction resolvase